MLKGKNFVKQRKNYGTINLLDKRIWVRYGDNRMWDDIDFPQNSHYCFQNRHYLSSRAYYKQKRNIKWM